MSWYRIFPESLLDELMTYDKTSVDEEGYLGIVRTFMQNKGRIWRGTTKRTGTAYFVRCIYRKNKIFP